jgi:hypothetical protein
MASAGGFTVTDVESAAEVRPAELVAVTLKMNVLLLVEPTGSVNVKLMAHDVEPIAQFVGFAITIGDPPVCCHWKLTGSPAGSTAVAVSVTGVPDETMRGAAGV